MASILYENHSKTARFFRYYRKTIPFSAYKKPSTLCLPMACEPDPASYPRSKKPAELDHIPSKHVEKTSSCQNSKPRMDYAAGELQITNSSLDAVLTRYEKMFGEKCSQSLTTDILKSMEGKTVKAARSSSFSLMKPKVINFVSHDP